jgi:AbiEi antitoxin C-terminal domain
MRMRDGQAFASVAPQRRVASRVRFRESRHTYKPTLAGVDPTTYRRVVAVRLISSEKYCCPAVWGALPDLSLWIKVLHSESVRATLLSMSGLQGLPDTFTTATALAHGVHPRVLYALRDSGDVVELSRGVFRRADAPLASEPDLLAVAYRSQVAIVCCRSAAAVHELSDELPPAVQIAVPTGRRPPRIAYPPTEVFRFAANTFEVELSRLEAAPGEWVRIYTPARTVIDLMRLRHRFGESLALAALQRYLRRREAAPAKLLHLASMFDVAGPVRRALDVATAE